jgi:hypothetical protein
MERSSVLAICGEGDQPMRVRRLLTRGPDDEPV